VWFGRLPDEELAGDLLSNGVDAVLDLCAEHSEARSLRTTDYLNLPILDLAMPEPETLDRAIEFLERRVVGAGQGKVYVHCALGYERSAVVVAAWLLHSGRVPDVDTAVAAVRAARSPRIPAARLRAALTRTR
jgi:protein-tyrosine phosphatase